MPTHATVIAVMLGFRTASVVFFTTMSGKEATFIMAISVLFWISVFYGFLNGSGLVRIILLILSIYGSLVFPFLIAFAVHSGDIQIDYVVVIAWLESTYMLFALRSRSVRYWMIARSLRCDKVSPKLKPACHQSSSV